ncbi:MAG TPA: hypothetical protein PLN89_08540 [Elusimicrobiota bacterium]|jgi:hypothetical protein|nr:hypothetical protein [Elusimicrobiota bacterium]HNF59608.1 hypothetical protein [Elusimicrobiota bacterium]HNG45457.1 hypothetical protein [Elusimicrobiota bacterium]
MNKPGKMAMYGSVALFLLSCFMPCLYIARPEGPVSWNGFEILLLNGWMAILAVISVAWLANPLYFFAGVCVLNSQKGGSSLSSGLGIIVSLAAVLVGGTSFWVKGVPIPKNEGGGTQGLVDHFGVGFYVWMASLLLMFLAAVLTYNQNRTAEKAL